MPSNLARPSSPLASSSAIPSHPRSYSQPALNAKQSSASPKRTSDSPSTEEPPSKMYKVEHTGAGPSRSDRAPYRGSGRGASSSLLARAHKNNASGGRGGKKKGRGAPNLPSLSGPLHDEGYITQTYRTKPIKKIFETNPKSPLNNYLINHTGQQMEFTSVHGIVEGTEQPVYRYRPSGRVQLHDIHPTILRCTTTAKYEDGEIIGVGDSPNKKSAENLAALSAVYQLDAVGAVCSGQCFLYGNVLTIFAVRQEEGKGPRRPRPCRNVALGWHRRRLRESPPFYGLLLPPLPVFKTRHLLLSAYS